MCVALTEFEVSSITTAQRWGLARSSLLTASHFSDCRLFLPRLSFGGFSQRSTTFVSSLSVNRVFTSVSLLLHLFATKSSRLGGGAVLLSPSGEARRAFYEQSEFCFFAPEGGSLDTCRGGWISSSHLHNPKVLLGLRQTLQGQ
jgi:hypothetical protein